ncbi:MAG: ankyrin repeat domain-containing protein [bacterium]
MKKICVGLILCMMTIGTERVFSLDGGASGYGGGAGAASGVVGGRDSDASVDSDSDYCDYFILETNLDRALDILGGDAELIDRRTAVDLLLTAVRNNTFDLNGIDSMFYNTALHDAVRTNNDLMAAILVDCGAELNIINIDGLTPLHLAVIHGRSEMVELLLAAGADETIRATFSRTNDSGQVLRCYPDCTAGEIARMDARGGDEVPREVRVSAPAIVVVFAIFEDRWNPLRRAWVAAVVRGRFRRERRESALFVLRSLLKPLIERGVLRRERQPGAV